MGLHLIPRGLPSLSETVAAVGGCPADIGRALGVSERTVWRWLAAGEAPRPAALALFWVTPWGWSQIDSEARHRLATAAALVQSLRDELTAERAQCARLLAMGYGAGSANVPVYRSASR